MTERTEQGKLAWWLVNGLFAVLMAFLTFGMNRMAGYVEHHREMIEANNQRIATLTQQVATMEKEIVRLRDFLTNQHDVPMNASPE